MHAREMANTPSPTPQSPLLPFDLSPPLSLTMETSTIEVVLSCGYLTPTDRDQGWGWVGRETDRDSVLYRQWDGKNPVIQ